MVIQIKTLSNIPTAYPSKAHSKTTDNIKNTKAAIFAAFIFLDILSIILVLANSKLLDIQYKHHIEQNDSITERVYI